jgi:hypothetical protein
MMNVPLSYLYNVQINLISMEFIFRIRKEVLYLNYLSILAFIIYISVHLTNSNLHTNKILRTKYFYRLYIFFVYYSDYQEESIVE